MAQLNVKKWMGSFLLRSGFSVSRILLSASGMKSIENFYDLEELRV